MNGCAPGLALIERLKVTRKWAICSLGHYVLRYVHESITRFIMSNSVVSLHDLQVLFSVTFLKKEGTKYLKITCVEVSSSLFSHGGRKLNFKLVSETNPIEMVLVKF